MCAWMNGARIKNPQRPMMMLGHRGEHLDQWADHGSDGAAAPSSPR